MLVVVHQFPLRGRLFGARRPGPGVDGDAVVIAQEQRHAQPGPASARNTADVAVRESELLLYGVVGELAPLERREEKLYPAIRRGGYLTLGHLSGICLTTEDSQVDREKSGKDR